jgi:branched-chain amino acid transport system substrate-binding protein
MDGRFKWAAKMAILVILALAMSFGGSVAQAQQEIRIGLLAPLTGPLAKSGEDSVRGHKLYWDQVGNKVAGRPVRIIVADTGCNPDNALTQTRRLIHAEKVHFIVGPLCGHEGKAVAQVSKETGVPVLMSIAAPDDVTKWNRVPTVIRTGFSASQNAHPFGDYLYKELGCRNATFIGQDYTFGQEETLGAINTFKSAGGKVAKIFWTPIGTGDYGPVLGGIPTGTDCVVATVVGTDRNRLFEQWFDFGYDRKYKIYGNYWLLNDVLPEADDRAIGLISQSLHFAAGIDTPENKAFVNAFAKKYKLIPSYFAENAYTTGLWAKTALEAIKGKVEDRKAFLQAVRKAKIVAPRGPITLDEYDNPIQNTYISKVAKVKHPILGEVLVNVPVKTYKAVSQFWTWSPKEYLARGPYKR